MAQFDLYLICTAPRSGSTLLCRLLAATGIAGNPESWFHASSVPDWAAELGLVPDTAAPESVVLAKVFRAAIAAGSRDTGLFGLRLQRHGFDFFAGKLAVLYPGLADDTARFRAAFGRTLFVHLTRDDKVGQAVSYVKADQTGLWHAAPDGTEIERLSPPRDPAYDAHAILAQVEEMAAYDRAWAHWFAAQGIEPFRVTYEALSADPSGILCRVLDRLGLDRAAAAGVMPGTARLADRTSREWVARFRAEQGMH